MKDFSILFMCRSSIVLFWLGICQI